MSGESVDALSSNAPYRQSSMARIAFISHWSSTGGAEKALLDIMRLLRDSGHTPLCVIPREGRMIDELRLLKIPYEIVHYTWWTGADVPLIVRLARTALQPLKGLWLAWKLRRFGPDLIYTNTITICVGGIAARISRCPHVWHIHEFPDNFAFKFDLGRKLTLPLVGMLSTRLLFVSRAVRAAYQELSAKSSSVLYQTVSGYSNCVQMAPRDPAGPFRVVIVGTIMPAKGQADAVRALELLEREGYQLDVVGAGSEFDEGQLKRLVLELGLSDRVVFHGYQANPMHIMARADVVLMCSENEAFGRVTAEAMLLGKAIVGTDSGATAELLDDNVTGLLYQFGDVRGLAAKIQQLKSDPGLRTRLGGSAIRRAAALFSEARYRDELAQVIRDSVRNR